MKIMIEIDGEELKVNEDLKKALGLGTKKKASVKKVDVEIDGEPEKEEAPKETPSEKVVYSLEQLTAGAIQLKDQGRIGEIQEMLKAFNVSSMADLKPEQYTDFAKALTEKGVVL